MFMVTKIEMHQLNARNVILTRGGAKQKINKIFKKTWEKHVKSGG